MLINVFLWYYRGGKKHKPDTTGLFLAARIHHKNIARLTIPFQGFFCTFPAPAESREQVLTTGEPHQIGCLFVYEILNGVSKWL